MPSPPGTPSVCFFGSVLAFLGLKRSRFQLVDLAQECLEQFAGVCASALLEGLIIGRNRGEKALKKLML